MLLRADYAGLEWLEVVNLSIVRVAGPVSRRIRFAKWRITSQETVTVCPATIAPRAEYLWRNSVVRAREEPIQ